MSDLNRLKRRVWRIHAGRFQVTWFVKQNLTPELIDALLNYGKVCTRPKVKSIKGRTSACHDNVVKYIKKHPNFVWYFGFGYSDGVWRVHSWAVSNNAIVETTVRRDIYFGVPLVHKK